MRNTPLIRNPSAACHYIPTSHPLHTPLAFCFSLFQGCFCLVYLGSILPFLWRFVKREARVGDMYKE